MMNRTYIPLYGISITLGSGNSLHECGAANIFPPMKLKSKSIVREIFDTKKVFSSDESYGVVKANFLVRNL